MDTEKRVLLAFALSFAMLMLWRTFMVKAPPPAPTAVRTQNQAAGKAQPTLPQVAIPAPAPVPAQQGTEAQEIVVDGALYHVTVSTRGAVVKSWILKKFKDAKQEPLDLVNQAACQQLGFPLSINVSDPELSRKLNAALFVVSPSGGTLEAPGKLTFTFSDGKVQVRKEITFESGYEARATVSISDGKRYLPVEVAWLGGFGDHSVPYAVAASLERAAYGTSEKLELIPQKKAKSAQVFPGPFTFAGLEDRFFAGVFIPGSPDEAFRVEPETWTPPDWKEKELPHPLAAAIGTPLPKPIDFRLFIGPKDLDYLRAEKPSLEGLVDFGWFSFVAKPLFLAMRYIYDHWVHNYGWAIVLLTVIINLLMFPLKLKSIRSAQEMQRVAPIIKGIQGKYKQYKMNDPRKQKMNQEIMKVYQEHKINPLGGCLPMVFQLPFLYGFYRVLDLSIELRHAPWIWWVKDLSAPDRVHLFGISIGVLPTIMIVTMFLLQKMTPVATTDPAQQRMMMIMPLIFGVMFYNFAAGLVLYWLTGNIVGIAQQLAINRLVPSPASGKTTVNKPAVPVRKPVTIKD